MGELSRPAALRKMGAAEGRRAGEYELTSRKAVVVT
jgi:hypothetical protein